MPTGPLRGPQKSCEAFPVQTHPHGSLGFVLYGASCSMPSAIVRRENMRIRYPGQGRFSPGICRIFEKIGDLPAQVADAYFGGSTIGHFNRAGVWAIAVA